MNNSQEDFSTKKISELLKRSPSDDGTFYSALYDLYFFISLAKGMDDIKNGKGMTLEKSRERMLKKYETYNSKYGS